MRWDRHPEVGRQRRHWLPCGFVGKDPNPSKQRVARFVVAFALFNCILNHALQLVHAWIRMDPGIPKQRLFERSDMPLHRFELEKSRPS